MMDTPGPGYGPTMLHPIPVRKFPILHNHRLWSASWAWTRNNDNTTNDACPGRFSYSLLLPNRRRFDPPHPPLPSRPRPLLPPLPLRPLLRHRPPHFPPLFSSMTTASDSSNFQTHADPSPTKTVRAVIKGRVQGVFYRNWTVDNATELKLKGWVRNRRDGSVEALLCGNPQSVDGMVERLRRGPPAAAVTTVEVSPSSDDPGTVGFERRPTV